MFLLDTNVISEIRKIKNGKANKGVETWFFATPLNQLFLNDIVLLEIKQGALLARYKNDLVKADTLDDWLGVQLPKQFKGRILPISQEICLKCAELHIPNQRDRHDALIAATALMHNFTVVTRNLKDFDGIDGLQILNPFTDL